MLFIGNNRKIPKMFIVTSPGTVEEKQKHHFCQEWLLIGLKPVVRISTQVFLELCDVFLLLHKQNKGSYMEWSSDTTLSPPHKITRYLYSQNIQQKCPGGKGITP